MSAINIELIDTTITPVPKKDGTGTYDKMVVTYKNLNIGKVDSKSLLGFGTEKEVFTKLNTASKGETFSIERIKNDKGYWDWIAVARQDGTTVQVVEQNSAYQAKPTQSSFAKSKADGRTFETPEERAAKQVMIVRQSSISSAVDMLKSCNKVYGTKAVIDAAKDFEAYVMGNGVNDLTSDSVE